jgi:hypothetical protein
VNGVRVREHPTYKYPPGDFISGFGGGYEQTCQNMVIAGLEWWDANPKADPKFKGFANVFGLIVDENDDAKALSKALSDAALGDCTGAMHQAAVSHVFYAHAHGWPDYVREILKKKPVRP